MIKLLNKRRDGTFIADLGNGPYHVIPDDEFAPAGLWEWAVAEAERLGDDLPFEPLPPPPPPPTPEELQAAYATAISAHVDAVAGQRRYSSGVHCASYVASTNAVWAAEAAAFIAWRDAVWEAATEMLADAESTGTVPSIEEAIAALPVIQWQGA